MASPFANRVGPLNGVVVVDLSRQLAGPAGPMALP
jgi:crotonobetainyl-CoA:carnitine CoA-transferase CaiB-like acyl-CoA transferase